MDKIDDLNVEINALKKRNNSLEEELNKMEREKYKHLEEIESLEDTILKLESLLPKGDENDKIKKKGAIEFKLALELEEKNKIIRDLKDRMGFLRKEKVQLQQELDKERFRDSDSTIIRTESLRTKTPLEVLVKELQDKVNKYKSIIEQLKRESIDVSEFDSKLKEKEVAIERKMAYSLQAQIDEEKQIIDLKNKELEVLKIECERMKRNLEVLEVQIKIKDQKITELNNQIKGKKNKKKILV
ncbi:MAG: hypothetical protein ACFFCG_12585 [Promethearchaeota archaeon]